MELEHALYQVCPKVTFKSPSLCHLQHRAQRIRLPGRRSSKVAERTQHGHCLRSSFLFLYFSASFFVLPSANLSFSIQQSISAEEIELPGAHISWGMGAP